MTVLLVLGTFLVFIVLDYFLNRRKALHTVAVEAQPAAAARLGSGYVDGFLVPENLSYHTGHSWLVRERQNVVRVGADEFAAALAGKIERIELPKPGQWIRQGQKVISFFRDGAEDRNGLPHRRRSHGSQPGSRRKPDPAAPGPLRQGLAVESVTFRTKRTRRATWSPHAGRRVDARSGGTPVCPPTALAGAVAADGGRPAEDLLAALPDANWKEVTGEFFLTA